MNVNNFLPKSQYQMYHSLMPVPLLESKACNLPLLKELMNGSIAYDGESLIKILHNCE